MRIRGRLPCRQSLRCIADSLISAMSGNFCSDERILQQGVRMMITYNEPKYILADTRCISIEKYLRIQGVIDNRIEKRVIELIRKFKGLQCSDDLMQPIVRTDADPMEGNEKDFIKRIPMHERRSI